MPNHWSDLENAIATCCDIGLVLIPASSRPTIALGGHLASVAHCICWGQTITQQQSGLFGKFPELLCSSA